MSALGHGARAEQSLCHKWLERFLFVEQPADRFALNATRWEQIEIQKTISDEVAKMPGVVSHLDSEGRYLSYVYSDNRGAVELPELRTVKLIIVDEIAPAPTSKVWIGMPFVNHPDAPALLKKIKAHGYELAFDPAISLTKNRAAIGGYFDPRQRFIGMRPETPYRTLQHEYAHLLFEEAVLSPFLRSESFARYAAAEPKAKQWYFQETAHEYADRLVDWLLTQEALSEAQASTLRMYARSTRTTTALTETFATDADLRLMDQNGVGRYFVSRNGVRRYQTYHQLADLESRFAGLSPADRKKWAALKWRSIYLEAAIELQLQWYRIPPVARGILRLNLPIWMLAGMTFLVPSLPQAPTTAPTTKPATEPALAPEPAPSSAPATPPAE